MESKERKSLSLLISQVLPGWTERENYLNRDFKFMDFTSAFSFMSEVALACEEIDHHPNWENTYNLVRVNLQTHTSSSITDKDLDLAKRMDLIYLKFSS
jgi:4a-hydroxytetrahydrobiopterin dehydratase